MGSVLSVYGCFQHKKQLRTRLTADQVGNDAESGLRLPLNGEKMVLLEKSKASGSKTLRSCVHLFQIIFQVDTESFRCLQFCNSIVLYYYPC